MKKLLNDEINDLMKELAIILESSGLDPDGLLGSGSNIFSKILGDSSLTVEVSSDNPNSHSMTDEQKDQMRKILVDILSNIEV